MQKRQRSMIRWALSMLVLVALATVAEAQSVELGVNRRQIYADVPFVLQVTARGFEEAPEPEVDDFEIKGANISYLGMSPSIRSSRTVINGQVTSSRDVRFVYSYRVEASSPGQYEIPAVTVRQGAVTATSRPGRFEASRVANSRDMRIELDVPNRPVWIGESFEVGVSWYLRKNPRDQTFVIPFFDHPAFEVEEPETSSSDRLAFTAGAKELELPYESSTVTEGGIEYTRFQFKAVATPTQAGVFELGAPRVVAKLQTGEGRDAFGFRSPRFELFKATGKPATFEVKALPRAGRPASFSNAVGSGFSIAVTTSRSVVSVGEPIELTVVLRGERGLAGLSLPSMIGEGRLSPELFDRIGDTSTGVMSEDGLSKTFKVTVVLKSKEAREIPPIEFSYFDPVDATFKTALSQPIALNVGGADMVGAQDVVGSSRKTRSENPGSGSARSSAFAGDLTPSAGDDTMRTVLSLASLRPLLIALYALPLVLLGVVLWLRRTGDARGKQGALREARKKVEAAAKAARSVKAEESAQALLTSAKELAKETGNRPGAWYSEIETLAYDPERRTKPVPEELVDQALADAKRWCERRSGGGKASMATLAFLIVLAGASTVHASATLASARASYAAALETTDRSERTRRFAETEVLYRELVASKSDRPELLADWGNAALGAGDLGTAALAYKRALRLDRGLVRATKNLSWIREQMPGQLAIEADAGAVDSLFFWHRDWSLATRHLVAAIAFATFILLLVPFGWRFAGVARRLSFVPLVLFVATLGSALLEADTSDAAVVIADGETLRSADSMGAPPAMSASVPAGLEVSLKERRGTWAQVRLPDGTTGWLSSSAVVAVDEPMRTRE